MTEPIKQIEQPFLPRYQVTRLIGEGAAAHIYQVTDLKDGSIRAIKALKPQANAEPSIVERFEEEYRILRRLHHPSLPEVYDYGFTQDRIRYIVMELVEGVQLDQYFQSNPQDLWLLLYELCEVLSFIHDRDLLHLDLKPANILVKRTSAYGDEKPMVVLMDFGLSYRRNVGGERSLVGTPEYMAPEIIKGDGRLTRAADYYSLGISLYQLLTGETPFHGTINDVFQGHLRQEIQFKKERTQFAELYPHVLGLVSKDINPRLEAFEEFRRAATGRLRGEIDDFESAYGLSIISSIGLVGKSDEWKYLKGWLDEASTSVMNKESSKRFQNADRTRKRHQDLTSAPKHPYKSEMIVTLEGPPGSGKSYLVDRVIQYAKFENTSVWRFGKELTFIQPTIASLTVAGHDSDIQSKHAKPNALLIDYFEHLWNRLSAHASSRMCLIIADGFESLSADERDFFEYLTKRLAIAEAENKFLRIFVLVTGNRPRFLQSLKERLPKTLSIRSHSVHSLQTPDFRQLIDALHETPVTAGDDHDLISFIEQFGESPGAVIAALQTAQIREALCFSGGRWRFHKNQIKDLTPESSPSQSFYQELLSKMPSDVKSTLECVCCHDGPVPTGLVSAILSTSSEEITARLKFFKPFRVFSRKRDDGVSTLSIDPPNVQKAIYRDMSIEARRRFHQAYIRHYRSYLGATDSPNVERRIATLEQLAFQYLRVEQYHDLNLIHVTLTKLLRKHRQFSRMRRACESALSALELQLETDLISKIYLRRRFFIKHLVDSCWVLSDYTAIQTAIDKYFLNHQSGIPVSLMLKYTLSLVSLGDPRQALAMASAIKSRFPKRDTVAHVTALLVEATVYSVTGRYSKALSILDEVANRQDILSEYGRCRLYMSYVTVYDTIHDQAKLLSTTAPLEALSEKSGFLHEYLTSQSARFSVALGNSELAECKKITKAAIAMASKHKLYNRLVYWYFRASNVYYEEGDYFRSIRHVNNALRLSEKLGYDYRVPELVTRLAMNYQGAGRYGNSITHIRNALTMWDRSWDPSVGAVIYLFALEAHLISNSRRSRSYWVKARRFISNHREVSRWSYFWYLAGLYHLHRNSRILAYKAFRKARLLDEKSDVRDDAARAGIKETFVLLDMMKFREAGKMLKKLESLCSSLESGNIRTEHKALQVAYHCAIRSRRRLIREKVDQCENEMHRAKEVPVLLSTERILIRAKLRLGDIGDASRYFNSHLRRIKSIVSNYANEEYAQDFLNNEDEKLLMEEYRIIRRKKRRGATELRP